MSSIYTGVVLQSEIVPIYKEIVINLTLFCNTQENTHGRHSKGNKKRKHDSRKFTEHNGRHKEMNT